MRNVFFQFQSTPEANRNVRGVFRKCEVESKTKCIDGARSIRMCVWKCPYSGEANCLGFCNLLLALCLALTLDFQVQNDYGHNRFEWKPAKRLDHFQINITIFRNSCERACERAHKHNTALTHTKLLFRFGIPSMRCARVSHKSTCPAHSSRHLRKVK